MHGVLCGRNGCFGGRGVGREHLEEIHVSIVVPRASSFFSLRVLSCGVRDRWALEDSAEVRVGRGFVLVTPQVGDGEGLRRIRLGLGEPLEKAHPPCARARAGDLFPPAPRSTTTASATTATMGIRRVPVVLRRGVGGAVPPLLHQQFRDDLHDERFQDEDATAHEPDADFDGGPHEAEAGVVDEVFRLGVDRGDSVRGLSIGSEHFFPQRVLEVGDADDVYDRDEGADGEGGDQGDLLAKLHAELGEDGQGEQQDGEVGQDVDGRRSEVERDDVDTCAHRVLVKRRPDGTALEDVEEGQDEAGQVDDGEGAVRGVPKERVGSGHADVEEEDGRLGGHERGVVEDRERVEGLFEDRLVLGADL